MQLIGDPELPHTYSYVPDIGRALAILGEREQALGRAWHALSPPTVSTRHFLELVFRERVSVLASSGYPSWPSGRSDSSTRTYASSSMTYEFEEPFVVDHGAFARAFGNHATPLEEAVSTTVDWFRELRGPPSPTRWRPRARAAAAPLPEAK